MSDPWGNQQAPQGGDPWNTPGAGFPAPQGGGPTPPSIDEVGAGSKMAFDQNSPVGAVVGGDVVSVKVEQDRFRPTWDDGNPNWRITVVVRTAQRESPEDDGERTIAIKTYGDNFRAFQDAVKDAGGAKTSDVLVVGGQFWAKLTEHRRSSQGGNPALMYAYKIMPPGGGTPPAQAPPQTAPGPQQTAPGPQPGQAYNVPQQPAPPPPQGVPEEPPF